MRWSEVLRAFMKNARCVAVWIYVVSASAQRVPFSSDLAGRMCGSRFELEHDPLAVLISAKAKLLNGKCRNFTIESSSHVLRYILVVHMC